MATTPYTAFATPVAGFVAATVLNVHVGPGSDKVTYSLSLGRAVTATGSMVIDGRTWVQLSMPESCAGGWVISQDEIKGKPTKVWITTTNPLADPVGGLSDSPANDGSAPVGWMAAVGIALAGFVVYKLTRKKRG